MNYNIGGYPICGKRVFLPFRTHRDSGSGHRPASLDWCLWDGVAPFPMGHLTRDKTKLLGRVRRLTGQMQAIERALDDEKACRDILNLVASVRGAVNGLMAELIEEHVQQHMVEGRTHEARAQAAQELISSVRSYLK